MKTLLLSLKLSVLSIRLRVITGNYNRKSCMSQALFRKNSLRKPKDTKEEKIKKKRRISEKYLIS